MFSVYICLVCKDFAIIQAHNLSLKFKFNIFSYKTLSIFRLTLKNQSVLTKRTKASNNKKKFILFVRSANCLLEQNGFFFYKYYPQKINDSSSHLEEKKVDAFLFFTFCTNSKPQSTQFQKNYLIRFSLRCFDLSRSFGLQM